MKSEKSKSAFERSTWLAIRLSGRLKKKIRENEGLAKELKDSNEVMKLLKDQMEALESQLEKERKNNSNIKLTLSQEKSKL